MPRENKPRQDCLTPPRIVQSVHEFFGGPPDLDPAAHPTTNIAKRNVCLPEDGLKIDWWPYKSIFCNPPYNKDKERGTSIADWTDKHVQETSRESLLLIPVAVDTKYWLRNVWGEAAAICWVYGRLDFTDPVTGQPYTSDRVRGMSLIYYTGPGSANARLAVFSEKFSWLGRITEWP